MTSCKALVASVHARQSTLMTHQEIFARHGIKSNPSAAARLCMPLYSATHVYSYALSNSLCRPPLHCLAHFMLPANPVSPSAPYLWMAGPIHALETKFSSS